MGDIVGKITRSRAGEQCEELEAFWKGMISMRVCGSGSPVSEGWAADLFAVNDYGREWHRENQVVIDSCTRTNVVFEHDGVARPMVMTAGFHAPAYLRAGGEVYVTASYFLRVADPELKGK